MMCSETRILSHPRAEAVAPGVWCLALVTPTLPPATTTNTVLVVGERVVVIEPGTPHADEQALLRGLLEELARAGHLLEAVVVTHHHPDHIGSAELFAQYFGVPVMAHPETLRRVGFAHAAEWHDGQRMSLGNDIELQGVFTPGHAPGHMAFLEKSSNVVYAGDMIAGEGSILIDPYDGGDMVQYLASLDRLDALQADLLIPAHGPRLRDPTASLAAYRQHRLVRESAIMNQLRLGPVTHEQILASVYGDTPASLSVLAQRSLEAHLRKLDLEGRIVRRDGCVLLGMIND